jgi:hypothetical protein
MECPNCGARGLTRAIRRCTHCGEAYVAEDLEELSRLGFLVEETAGWQGTEALRRPYVERLEALRARLERRAPAKPEAAAPAPAAPQAVVAPAPAPAPAAAWLAVVPAGEPAAARPRPAPAPPPVPPKEKVPFDQWLLSERNIKIALYAGALLLVAAGMIFVGVNWARIPGPAKFAITLLVTGLMYLGGYLLFRRPALRIGGIALLGVASGFVVVDFAILQLYVLGPAGLRDDVMWLIASPFCLALYLLTAYWTGGDLFTYLGLGALASAATAAVVVTGAPPLILLPVYALLAYGLLWLARAVQGTGLADFAFLPPLLVSQVGMVALAIAAIALWSTTTGCSPCPSGSPWLALLALGVAVLFYATTDVASNWLAAQPSSGIPQPVVDALMTWHPARWAAAVVLPVTMTLALLELDVGDTVSGLVLMLLALAYLGVGYALERREGRRAGAWPLYAMAYALALLVTVMAIPEADSLYLVLFGDVLLLALSAAIHRNYWWIYGAAWLFMLPIYLILDLYVPELVYRGLFMGLLGLNYALAGYALGRRSLWHGGPFLTAAAFLSVVAVGLTWGDPAIASLVLAVVAVLYLLAAPWLGWTGLLLPALLAVHLLVWSVNSIFLAPGETLWQALTISYAALGLVLGLGGLALRRRGLGPWSWPLYLAGGLDLAGTYLAGLVQGGLLAIGLSVVVALLLLSFAWLERAELAERKLPPLLTYAALAVVFVGHYHVLDAAGIGLDEAWPPITAGLCALFVGLAWLPRREPLAGLYGTPLRWAGWALMAIPLVAVMALSVVYEEAVWAVVTLAIAGLTYGLDGAARQVRPLAWLTLGILFVWHFFVMGLAGVEIEGAWWPITGALCGLFVALGWLLRCGPLAGLYAVPLRYAGLVLMAIPLVGSVAVAVFAEEPAVLAVTFALAGLAFGADGALRRVVWLVYLGVGALVVVIWGAFWTLGIGELQAYVFPLGLALLGTGWNERRQGRSLTYQGCTLLGLVLLMGTAFGQSLGRGNWPYSLLLLAESLAAVGWGAGKHLRRWVQVGGVALLANGVAQLGPAVLELSGWIQLGLVGTILFGGGMLALIRREELLAARQRLAGEWRQWQP